MPRIVHARETRFGGYLEDYEAGDVFHHWPGKTVTEAEVHQFCMLTFAFNPVHIDAHYASDEMRPPRNIAVGTYVYAVLLGMSVPDISGRAVANLGTEHLRHVAPLFYGDTLYGSTEIVGWRVSRSRPAEGILTVDTTGSNQSGLVVCTFRRHVLLPRRDAAAAPLVVSATPEGTGTGTGADGAGGAGGDETGGAGGDETGGDEEGERVSGAAMTGDPGAQALEGIRIVDMATIVAGPAASKYFGDFGAEVIKVEAPGGDSARRLGWALEESDDSFFWKIIGRNKKCVTLDVKSDAGLKAMLELLDSADALVENLRPGTLERLGLGPEVLLERNPRLVVLRVTGFGQTGPYASKPGFATIAEALTGYAAISGEPEGQPLLPPIAITDEVTGIVGAFALMAALWYARGTGIGQVVDVNLSETLLQLMGPLVPAYAHLGYEQPRMGSALPWTVPRGTYQCADGRWVALSASADSVAARLLGAIGLDGDGRFTSFRDRMANSEVLENLVRSWIGARSCAEVLEHLEGLDAAVAPVYSMGDIFADAHFREREVLIEVDGIVMPNVIARFSRTPGKVRHAGRPQGADQALVEP